MNKEEIYKRIMVCEKKERDFLEAGNTRTANRYHNEIKEIEKTIELLSGTGSCRIPNLQYKKHILEETLQKYKEIVNGSERN